MIQAVGGGNGTYKLSEGGNYKSVGRGNGTSYQRGAMIQAVRGGQWYKMS